MEALRLNSTLSCERSLPPRDLEVPDQLTRDRQQRPRASITNALTKWTFAARFAGTRSRCTWIAPGGIGVAT